MGRTTMNVSAPGFIADHGSVRREPGGRQIDWTQVPAAYDTNAQAGKGRIPAGTPVAEIVATGRIVPRVAGALPAGQAPLGLIVSDAHEDHGPGKTEGLSGYGVYRGAVVFEDLLPKRPDGTTYLDATIRAELEGLPGGGFAWKRYSDDRAS